MTVMTAPPSTKAEIVDVPFAHRELVKRLSPGGRYIDAETEVDSPWVPFGDNAAIKHLAFDVRSNTFSNILWVKQPGESDGTCRGGPKAGSWWTEVALELSRAASTLSRTIAR